MKSKNELKTNKKLIVVDPKKYLYDILTHENKPICELSDILVYIGFDQKIQCLR